VKPKGSAAHPEDDISLEKRRDVTPIAKLFAEDAEYASVFKSRPKIATSPVESSPAGRWS